MRVGKGEKVRTGGGSCRLAPVGWIEGMLIVREEAMSCSECLEHALQYGPGFLRSDETLAALGGDANEAELGNGGG